MSVFTIVDHRVPLKVENENILDLSPISLFLYPLFINLFDQLLLYCNRFSFSFLKFTIHFEY